MDKRHVIAYILACVGVYFGVSMMIDNAGEVEPSPDAGGAQVTELDPESLFDENGEPLGGYLGSGKPQVEIVGMPDFGEEDVRPPRPVAEVNSDKKFEGESRGEALRETLKNLEGMDVYVEGIDGKAPKKR
jgi:hypothetical protein